MTEKKRRKISSLLTEEKDVCATSLGGGTTECGVADSIIITIDDDDDGDGDVVDDDAHRVAHRRARGRAVGAVRRRARERPPVQSVRW